VECEGCVIVDLLCRRFLCAEMRIDGNFVMPLIRGAFEPPDRLAAVPGSAEYVLFGNYASTHDCVHDMTAPPHSSGKRDVTAAPSTTSSDSGWRHPAETESGVSPVPNMPHLRQTTMGRYRWVNAPEAAMGR
jgi:hypothetical protein